MNQFQQLFREVLEDCRVYHVMRLCMIPTLFVKLPQVKEQITQYIQKLTKLKIQKNGLLLKYVNPKDHTNAKVAFRKPHTNRKKRLQQTTLRL